MIPAVRRESAMETTFLTSWFLVSTPSFSFLLMNDWTIVSTSASVIFNVNSFPMAARSEGIEIREDTSPVPGARPPT